MTSWRMSCEALREVQGVITARGQLLTSMLSPHLKIVPSDQVGNIFLASSEEIIETDHLQGEKRLRCCMAQTCPSCCIPYIVASIDEIFAKVRSNESSSACDQASPGLSPWPRLDDRVLCSNHIIFRYRTTCTRVHF